MKLHLVVKAKWFDMIKSGEKKEEYRELTMYWHKRIWRHWWEIHSIVFHRGYTNIIHERECTGVSIVTGKKEWGADINKKCTILRLGKEY